MEKELYSTQSSNWNELLIYQFSLLPLAACGMFSHISPVKTDFLFSLLFSFLYHTILYLVHVIPCVNKTLNPSRHKDCVRLCTLWKHQGLHIHSYSPDMTCLSHDKRKGQHPFKCMECSLHLVPFGCDIVLIPFHTTIQAISV